jgi:hypothetical protein
VDPDRGAIASVAFRDRDVDLDLIALADGVERRGAAAAEDSAGSSGQDSAHPVAAGREALAPHHIDAFMQQEQAPGAKAMLDRARAETHRAELPSCHGPVLPVGEGRYLDVDRIWFRMTLYFNVFRNLIRHTPSVSEKL